MNPEHACAAALSVARRYGIEAPGARVIGVWNNTIVHLAPQPLVAKVSSLTGRPAAATALGTELEIAQHLQRAGASIVPPSSLAPVQVHQEGEHVLTFWRLHPHDPDAALHPAAAARTLERVHRALATYQGQLPSFLSRQVRRAGRLLGDPDALPELPVPVRALLAAEHDRLAAALAARALDCRPLHGDPHRGNFLAGPAGCVMIDFESVCSGPVEWDLSALPEAAAGLLPADPELLDMLRRLRSVCVATWCWARPGRSAEIDRAARLHLDRLLQPGPYARPLAA
jgi:Ser/Thr protein kinase RdoA (MazF antagonist)